MDALSGVSEVGWQAPVDMLIYAIGDIHGHLDKLKDAHALISKDRMAHNDAAAPVVHLGDLVDRGPESRGVIEYLMAGIADNEPWIVLKGNHDQVFIDSARGEEFPMITFDGWTSAPMGGAETLRSYGVAPQRFALLSRQRRNFQAAVPEEHLAFLEGLPVHYETPDILFVHAGIRPGLRLHEQIEEDLLWIRGDFLHDPRDHGHLIVHGHTPADTPEHHGNRVNLDTGAGYGRELTAAVFEYPDVWILDAEHGRIKLEPDPFR